MASIELLKIILQLIKISPSFNLDDGFDLDDGVRLPAAEHSFEICRYFLEIKNQNSIVYLELRL